MYEVLRCNEETRNKDVLVGCLGEEDDCTVDPKCADKDHINEWLDGKKLTFKVINNKINLAQGSS